LSDSSLSVLAVRGGHMVDAIFRGAARVSKARAQERSSEKGDFDRVHAGRKAKEKSELKIPRQAGSLTESTCTNTDYVVWQSPKFR